MIVPPQTPPPAEMSGPDTAWMLVATALVLLMTPALGFFYGGLVRAKNALNTMMMSVAALGVAEGRVDFVIFFWDPLEPHPHDVDVKALLRIAVVYNIPIACNRASADFMLSSPLMGREYERLVSEPRERLRRLTPTAL